MFRKNFSGLEFPFGVIEQFLAYCCKGGEKLTVFCITYCTHAFKCEVYHAATNKLINLLCPLLIDLPEFEVLKSFLFTHIVNFDDSPPS
jgi:hypothetical protein